MSKPIFMTPEIIEEVTENFKKQAASLMLFRGKRTIDIDYYWVQSKNPEEREHVTITFSRAAWKKQQTLIQNFTSEVGWHGVVTRDQENPLHFTIEDIIVFPQIVTGTTVTPNDEAYAVWNATLPPAQRNAMRFHGHSHVNMGVTPSGTDDKYQQDMLGRLNGDGLTEEAKQRMKEAMGDMAFYIFMIFNKSGSHNVRVFDYWGNTYYEGDEITVEHEPDELADFLAEAKSKVSTKSYSYGNNYGGSYYGSAYSGAKTASLPPATKGSGQKTEDKSSKKGGSQSVRGSAADDDHRSFPSLYDEDDYEYGDLWWMKQYGAYSGR